MIPNEIFGLGLSSKAIVVFCCLVRHAGKDHSCYPARALIAEECSVSVSSVDRAPKELVDYGLIQKVNQKRIDGGKTSNRYFLSVF